MSDVRAAFWRASNQFECMVASLDPASLGVRTVCEVSIRELVEHVIAGNEFAVRLLAGASADEARSGIDDMKLGASPVQQVASSCISQTDAFAESDRNRPLHHPNGDIDYDTFVRFRLGELIVHSWDIAVAGALDLALEPESVKDLWGRIGPHLDEMRVMGAYGAGSKGLPADAPIQDQVLDAFGRRPQSGCSSP